MRIIPLTTLCARCHRPLGPLVSSSRPLHSTAHDEPASAISHPEAGFDEWSRELQRRKRKTDAKRRQKVSQCFEVGPERMYAHEQGASFVDHIIGTVRGGRGGPGATAFSSTSRGGLGPPSGGNGAPGGSIYLTTSPHLTSLSGLSKRMIGAPGSSGSGALRHGRRGQDTLISVPVGTVVRQLRSETEDEKIRNDERGHSDETKKVKRRERMFVTHPSAELSDEEWKWAESMVSRRAVMQDAPIELDLDTPLATPLLLARGGQGGVGNPHFHIAPNQFLPSKDPDDSRPIGPGLSRVATRGTTPPTLTFEFELKLLADVGLVGLPNAGKSTLLRALTGSKTEVAGYEFTTLNPQVGVVRVYEDDEGFAQVVEESSIERERDFQALLRGDRQRPFEADRTEVSRFTISDNPGLLPDASKNVGLGHSFLRSIERSLLVVYVLDLSKQDPSADLRILRGELEAYETDVMRRPGDLSGRAGLVVCNKADQVDEDTGKQRLDDVQSESRGMEVVVVSGKYGLGLGGLAKVVAGKVEAARRAVSAKSS